MPRKHKHIWLPYFYEIAYVGDGKNVNYRLATVYCHECGLKEEV